MTDEDERIDRAKRIREKLDGGDAETDAGESETADDSAEVTAEDDLDEGEAETGPAEAAGGTANSDLSDEADSDAADDVDSAESDEMDSARPNDSARQADADEAATADEDERATDWTTTETVDAAAAADAPDVQPTGDDQPAGAAESQAASDDEEAAAGPGDGAEDDTESAVAETDDEESDDDDSVTMYVPGADVGDVEIDVAQMAEQAGLESVDDEGADDGDEDAARPAGVDADAETGARASEETRVLEFSLGSEQYCLDIGYVEEIVEYDSATRVPNTPDYVEGVVDLRGQITTVLDPKVTFDIDETGRAEHIVVFDPDAFEEQGAIGWVVDDVDRVAPVSEDEINDSPVDDDHVNGVVDRGEDLVIWTSPVDAIEEATG